MPLDATGLAIPDLRFLPGATGTAAPLICTCAGITRSDIERAVAALAAGEDAAISPGRVYRFLGKRPSCGSCMDKIREMLPKTGAAPASPILF